MAKVTVVGQAIVVKSDLALDDIKMVVKYRPEALVLMGGEDNKEEIFRIGTGVSGINKYGASFGEESRDAEKKAIITMVQDFGDEDIKEYVADKFGAALINLGKLEQSIPAVIEEIKAERASIIEGITLA